MVRSLATLVVAAALVAAAPPSFASQHLTKVVEIFPGTVAQPDAQYIVIQMYNPGENFFSGYSVRVFDASDSPVATFTFPANLPNGADQSKVLLATTDAETLFGVTADLVMTPSLPLAGGAVCFGLPPTFWFDCHTWGNYVDGPGNAGTSGTPYEAAVGLTRGQAVVCGILAEGNADLNATDCVDDVEHHKCGDARPLANPVGSTPGFLAASPPCPSVRGKLMFVKDPEPGIDATRRRIIVKAKEVGSPNPITGDPIAGGATLKIALSGTTPSSQTFVLPAGAAFWSALGTSGFRYKDNNLVNGPIEVLVVKKTVSGMFLMMVRGKGSGASPLNLVPPNTGTEARLSLVPGGGGDRYCVAFGKVAGGTFGTNTTKVFTVKNPPTEGLCPP